MMAPSDQSNSPLSVDLGDGRTVRMDRPPADVLAAVKRINTAAIRAGREPDPADGALAVLWLDAQEAKHPTKERRS